MGVIDICLLSAVQGDQHARGDGGADDACHVGAHGMGTVFFGLICLIALTYLMSAVVGRGKKAAPAPVPAAPQTAGEVTPELVAAVSAALAEELGTDITGIRIVSMKKV